MFDGFRNFGSNSAISFEKVSEERRFHESGFIAASVGFIYKRVNQNEHHG